MIAIAEEVIILCDSTKMNVRGFGKICSLDKIDVLITDDGIDFETKTKLEEIGMEVIIASWK